MLGFDCGDGWYNIIDVLCGNIQHHVNQKRKDRARVLKFNRALKRALAGDTRPLQMHFTFGNKQNQMNGQLIILTTYLAFSQLQVFDGLLLRMCHRKT